LAAMATSVQLVLNGGSESDYGGFGGDPPATPRQFVAEPKRRRSTFPPTDKTFDMNTIRVAVDPKNPPPFMKPVDEIILKTPLVLIESDSMMIDPRSPFRICWDLLVIVPLLIYFAVAMPFQVGFAGPTPAFEVGIDVLFLVDIVLNFRTGYFVTFPHASNDDKDHVEFDRWRVAKSYFTGWFLLDAASGIPFSLIELLASADPGGVSNLKTIKTLKLLRTMKFARLLKLEKIMRNLDRDTSDKIGDFLQHGYTRTFYMM
jgi:hypothetical protein